MSNPMFSFPSWKPSQKMKRLFCTISMTNRALFWGKRRGEMDDFGAHQTRALDEKTGTFLCLLYSY